MAPKHLLPVKNKGIKNVILFILFFLFLTIFSYHYLVTTTCVNDNVEIISHDSLNHYPSSQVLIWHHCVYPSPVFLNEVSSHLVKI